MFNELTEDFFRQGLAFRKIDAASGCEKCEERVADAKVNRGLEKIGIESM